MFPSSSFDMSRNCESSHRAAVADDGLLEDSELYHVERSMLPLKAMVSRLSDESGVAGVAGEGEREPAAVAEEEDMMGGNTESRKREHWALYLTAWECPPCLAAALTASELRPHSHPLFRDRFELLWQR